MERLSGVVRDYDWGHLDAIAGILGHRPPGHPEAEYWLGAHPGAPSRLGSDGPTLDRAIADRPAHWLGDQTVDRFGQLPYLVKILAARQALSIQAHPSLEQAAVGFAREEAAGLAADAPTRSYRDANHKPELICALTRFEARCGFRRPELTGRVLAVLGPAIDPVRHQLDRNGPAATATWLLRQPVDEGRRLAEAAADGARAALAVSTSAAGRADVATGGGGKDPDPDPDLDLRAELASIVDVATAFPGDVGVVVAILLNHLVLEPGQALFLAAGTLHAYLSGVGVEVMANSDNVLRGGLTGKHIDIDELVTIVDDGVGPAPVQTPTGAVHTYDTPIPEFRVTRIDGSTGPVTELDLTPCGPEIVLVTAGVATLRRSGESLVLDRGQAALVAPADGPYGLTVEPSTERPGEAMAWRVTVG